MAQDFGKTAKRTTLNPIVMKKVLFVLTALCASYFTQAQTQSFGPTAGFNWAWLSDIDDVKGRPSFNIGFTYNYSILESAGIGIEARYSEEGARWEDRGETFTTRLNYIRVPMEFHYFFGRLGERIRPKIFAGPSFAFLVGGKADVGVGGQTVDSRDFYEGFDVGLMGGIGFNYRLAERTWLNFDFAYTHGLLDVVQESTFSDAQNRMVNLNVGVAFGIGE